MSRYLITSGAQCVCYIWLPLSPLVKLGDIFGLINTDMGFGRIMTAPFPYKAVFVDTILSLP